MHLILKELNIIMKRVIQIRHILRFSDTVCPQYVVWHYVCLAHACMCACLYVVELNFPFIVGHLFITLRNWWLDTKGFMSAYLNIVQFSCSWPAGEGKQVTQVAAGKPASVHESASNSFPWSDSRTVLFPLNSSPLRGLNLYKNF